MKIKIDRSQSTPPPRDYSSRNSAEAVAERLTAHTALESLKVGQSIHFTGADVTRDKVNSFIASLLYKGNTSVFSTAAIPGGIGVWRI